MNKRVFSLVATSLLILPFGVNATQPTSMQANNVQESESNVSLLAQNRFSRGKRMGRGGGMEKLLQQLDLTPEQSQQIEAIQEQFRSGENTTLSQEMQASREEMRSLWAQDASGEQLRQQHEQLQGLRQQLSDNRFETMLQIREVLTPEQRLEMAELVKQRSERRGDRPFNNDGNFN